MDFIQIKNFCSSENTVKKMKKQATDWEKVSVKHLSEKGPVSRIYKDLLQLNDEKRNTIQKWA